MLFCDEARTGGPVPTTAEAIWFKTKSFAEQQGF